MRIEQKFFKEKETSTQRELDVYAIFKTENGKRKLVDIHFPDKTIRAIFDACFVGIKNK